mmetsp:Transcript_86744/g.163581  ORF Transcript_86744/g.163581 Transcript_86744/m.163581 type:complete len:267 (+) Transcript_86744:67-867(+)
MASAEGEDAAPEAKAEAEEPAPAAEASAPENPRTRVGEARCVGLVVEWRGYMGWIQPLAKVDHELATRHQGRIYLNVKDVVQTGGKTRGSRIKEGKVVDFFIYADGDGLGAEECSARTVLRLTLPHKEMNKLKLTGLWSKYLSDSEYYPSFESEHGVLLRKYNWKMAFALLELWGHPDQLAAAAVALATKDQEADQECSLRLLLPENDVAKVEKIKEPVNPKVSNHAVITDPIRCRSLMFQGPAGECTEAVKTFLATMAVPTAGGA